MENMTARQKELFEQLHERVPDLVVRWNEERGVASVIEGSLMPWARIETPGALKSSYPTCS